MNKTAILPFLFLLAILSGCNRSGLPPATASEQYIADSTATVGKAIQFSRDRQYEAVIPPLDSVFTLPVDTTGSGKGLTVREAQRLSSIAIRQLMFAYNRLKKYEEGLEHFRRLEQSGNVILTNYCRRELWVCSGQMLQGLGRRAEAYELLNRAMELHENDDPQSELFCTIVAGTTYLSADSLAQRAKPTLLRSVAAMEQAGYDESGLYPQALANLAGLYLHNGEYEKCIELCQRVIDHSKTVWNLRGAQIAAFYMCMVYRELDMYEDALRYVEYGLNEFNRDQSDWSRAGDLYRIKADVLEKTGERDSVMPLLAVADSCYIRARNPRGQMQVFLDKCRQTIAIQPDSIPVALVGMKSIEQNVPGFLAGRYSRFMGDLLLAANRPREAVHWFGKALDIFTLRDNVPDAGYTAERLMHCYGELGMKDAAFALFPQYRALADSTLNEAKTRQMISANIRYETDRVKQANELLQTELQLKKRTLEYYISVALAVGLLVLLLVVWLLQRHRAAARKLKDQEAQLRRMLTDHLELNRNLEELRTELERTDSGNNMDKVLQSLSPRLLTANEEAEFRRQFLVVYPRFISRLREYCPSVTSSEELLSMLIRLNMNNAEIALALGNNLSSVHTSRSRLRKKMNISKEDSLDEVIRRL